MLEALAIRFLWICKALSPKRKPGLCPPQCEEMHTYEWPCRARVRTGWWASYFARPKVNQRGSN